MAIWNGEPNDHNIRIRRQEKWKWKQVKILDLFGEEFLYQLAQDFDKIKYLNT